MSSLIHSSYNWNETKESLSEYSRSSRWEQSTHGGIHDTAGPPRWEQSDTGLRKSRSFSCSTPRKSSTVKRIDEYHIVIIHKRVHHLVHGVNLQITMQTIRIAPHCHYSQVLLQVLIERLRRQHINATAVSFPKGHLRFRIGKGTDRRQKHHENELSHKHTKRSHRKNLYSMRARSVVHVNQGFT